MKKYDQLKLCLNELTMIDVNKIKIEKGEIVKELFLPFVKMGFFLGILDGHVESEHHYIVGGKDEAGNYGFAIYMNGEPYKEFGTKIRTFSFFMFVCELKDTYSIKCRDCENGFVKSHNEEITGEPFFTECTCKGTKQIIMYNGALKK